MKDGFRKLWLRGATPRPPPRPPPRFGEEGEKGLARPGEMVRRGLSRSENRFARGSMRLALRRVFGTGREGAVALAGRIFPPFDKHYSSIVKSGNYSKMSQP